MKTIKDSPDLEPYLIDALDILKTAVKLFHEGKKGQYRVAALQLRLLLCDTTRRHGEIVDISLLPRLYPDLKLPALSPDGKPLENSTELPLILWLEQMLATPNGPSISVRRLIRKVCDQDGGAHVDIKPHAGFSDFRNFREWIISIAKVVIGKLTP